MSQATPNYLQPGIPAGLKWVSMPVVPATAESLHGFGQLIARDQYEAFQIEIVRWPASGWRPVDEDSGDEGGTTAGIFTSQWKGDILYGVNEAVGGHYILGYSQAPESATEDHSQDPTQLLMWHANYHPDGGQLFFPLQPEPFYVPLALPGDDVRPEDFICFQFTGEQGLYIHPNIWHDGVFARRGTQRFFDRQGAVHARVSVDFPREFHCLLAANLTP